VQRNKNWRPGSGKIGLVGLFWPFSFIFIFCFLKATLMRHFVVTATILSAFSATLLLLAPATVQAADQKPRELAMETYRFLDAAQGKLDTWVKNANKADYFSQFSNPAKTIAAKWPQPLKEEYYDYADCYFALDLLIRYTDKAVVDKSWNDPVEVARKTRFTNALRECQRDLRKML
jgi:hypothetical protein